MTKGFCTGKRTGREYEYILFEHTESCKTYLLGKGFKKVDFINASQTRIETSENNIYNQKVLIYSWDVVYIVFDHRVKNHPHFIENTDEFNYFEQLYTIKK